EMVCLALGREGYRTEAFGDGLTAWEAFARGLPDLVILDIGLPRLDGLELCRRLRARSETLPIIFVTSREEEFDRVLGLETGARAYLCKPFWVGELMARVKGLLRRGASAAERPPAEQPVTTGALVLDPLRFSTTWKGQAIALTVTEFFLLQALAVRPGIVKTREQLMTEAYPDRVSVS